MRRLVLLFIVGLALGLGAGGCGGSAPDRDAYVKANDAVFSQLPVFPGARLREKFSAPAYAEEEGPVVGYTTRYLFDLPPSAQADEVASFYQGQLEPQWQLFEQLDGPVLNFRAHEALVSINLEGSRGQQLELAVDHKAAAASQQAAARGGSATPNIHYTDPAGWSLTYPHGMRLERSQAQSRISVSEVTVASFLPETAVHTETTRDREKLYVHPPRNSEGQFPADAIAFRLLAIEGGPAPAFDVAESRFPLRLTDFRASSSYPHSQPRPRERMVVANGRRYLAYVWIGEGATLERRAALEGIVSSLAFRRLRPGSTVGYGFLVLEQADRYPLGSFTRFIADGRPFYLVHAPGGFYAIGWKGVTSGDGYRARCLLRPDRARRQFFCANMRARWDRVGRVIRRPPDAHRGEPLLLSFAKLAWDGHVLFRAGDGSYANSSIAQHFWPGWRRR